jgi:membrane fusion protein, multidrug efflux system
MDDHDFGRAPVSQSTMTPTRRKTGFFSVGRIVGLVILLLAIGVVVWIVEKPHQAPAQRGGRFGGQAAMPVVAAAAAKGDMPVVLNELGTVTPLATVTVKTQIAGQLQQVAFQEGQMVKAGDFLAQIDPRPFQVALEQAEGTLAKDQATLDNANVDLIRYQKLYKQDSVAQQTLDTQVSLVHQLEGTVKTDKGLVDSSKLNLVYCHIVAPVTGRVGLRQVDQGNYVQTSDANGIVLITQLQPISVIFTLPEDNLPDLMKRLKTESGLQVTAYDRTQTTKLAVGKLDTVDNNIDTTTGTVKIRALFDNPDSMLFPSQFVNAALQLDVLHDAILVPVSAVQRGAPGTFVYVVKPDNTVTVRVVTLGPGNSDKVSVSKGLEVGELVVVDGADKLREGAAVSLPEAKPAQQGTDAKPADGAETKPAGDDAKPAKPADGEGDQTKGQHRHHKDSQ